MTQEEILSFSLGFLHVRCIFESVTEFAARVGSCQERLPFAVFRLIWRQEEEKELNLAKFVKHAGETQGSPTDAGQAYE